MTFTPIDSSGAEGGALMVPFAIVVSGTPTPATPTKHQHQPLRLRLRQTQRTMNGGYAVIQTRPAARVGARPPNGIDPIYDYPHTAGQCITGGYVYRGNAIPAYKGTCVFGDFLGLMAVAWGESSPSIMTAADVRRTKYHDATISDASGQFQPRKSGVLEEEC